MLLNFACDTANQLRVFRKHGDVAIPGGVLDGQEEGTETAAVGLVEAFVLVGGSKQAAVVIGPRAKFQHKSRQVFLFLFWFPSVFYENVR